MYFYWGGADDPSWIFGKFPISTSLPATFTIRFRDSHQPSSEKPEKSTNWNEYIFLECLDFPNGPVATELRPANDANKMEIFIGIPKIQ